jgi:hypothetical protein
MLMSTAPSRVHCAALVALFLGIRSAVVPANDKVIGNGHDPDSCDRRVCTDIRGTLILEASGVFEPKNLRNRGVKSPQTSQDWMGETSALAAIPIFLTSSKFVVHLKMMAISKLGILVHQGHCIPSMRQLLEATMSPICKLGNVALDLKSQSHVKVLRDIGFRPEHVPTIFRKSNVLQGRSTEHGIVTHKMGRRLPLQHRS